MNQLSIPNKITLLRLLMVPWIITLLYQQNAFTYKLSWVLLFIFILADLLDGYIAQKLNQQTDLGAVLDPLVDLIMAQSLMFVLLTLQVYEFKLLVFFMFIRDISVVSLRNFLRSRNVETTPSRASKLKFVFQMLSINCGLLYLITSIEAFKLSAALLLAIAFLFSLQGLISLVKNLRPYG